MAMNRKFTFVDKEVTKLNVKVKLVASTSRLKLVYTCNYKDVTLSVHAGCALIEMIVSKDTLDQGASLV